MRPAFATSPRAKRPPAAVPGSLSVTQIFGALPSDDLVASGYEDYAVFSDNVGRGYTRNHPRLFSPIPVQEGASLVSGAGGFLLLSWSPAAYSWSIENNAPVVGNTSSTSIARVSPTVAGGRIYWDLPAGPIQKHYQLHISPYYIGVPVANAMRVRFALSDASATPFEQGVPLIANDLAYRRYDCLANAGTAGQTMRIEINFPNGADANLQAYYQAILYGGTPP
jgi:hypothetical protein